MTFHMSFAILYSSKFWLYLVLDPFEPTTVARQRHIYEVISVAVGVERRRNLFPSALDCFKRINIGASIPYNRNQINDFAVITDVALSFRFMALLRFPLPLMSPSGKKPSGKEQAESQSEEAEGEDMQVHHNQQFQHTNSTVGHAPSRSRGSSPGRFHFPDPFQQVDSIDHPEDSSNYRLLEPSIFQHQYHHARHQREHTYQDSHHFGSGTLDPYPLPMSGTPGMHPSGMSPLDQASSYDCGTHHGYGLSRNQSFDWSLGFFSDAGGPIPQNDPPTIYPPLNLDGNEGLVSEANILDWCYMYTWNAHHNLSIPQLNDEALDDRKPSPEDFSRQQGQSYPGYARRVYPTQDRNPTPLSHAASRRDSQITPYAAALLESNQSHSVSEHETLSSGDRSGLRSRRSVKAPPVASLPKERKSAPKKGRGNRSKFSRRCAPSSQGSMVYDDSSLPCHIAIPTSPSAEELENTRTPRAKQALLAWYRHLHELVEYKKQHGDSKYTFPTPAFDEFFVISRTSIF
jgi:hypothetical protein